MARIGAFARRGTSEKSNALERIDLADMGRSVLRPYRSMERGTCLLVGGMR
jgi:hypothetical protein